MNIAKVIVPVPIRHTYDYKIPEDMLVQKGHIVLIPLGSRQEKGLVIEVTKETTCDPKKLRSIKFVYSQPPFSPALIDFILKFGAYNLVPYGDILKSFLRGHVKHYLPKTEGYYRLTEKQPLKQSPKKQAVLDYLKDNPIISGKALKSCASTHMIKSLSEEGVLEKFQKEIAYDIPNINHIMPEFNPEQVQAIDTVKSHIKVSSFKVFLLDGVTGSGKTETFLEMMTEIFYQGKQVLLLMPEIALTNQAMLRFEKRFGIKPVTWHAQTTDKQRENIRHGVEHNKIRIVIGARSALFLPFARLGMIVIDEEHDGSYKQQDIMRYHARDMAILRAKCENIPIILASATPSLESFVNGALGRYDVLPLRQRYSGASLPNIHLVNMQEHKQPAQKWISHTLYQAINATYEKGEQSLLFINRRGYAPLMLCRACGYRIECPFCSAWMIYHTHKGGDLRCHQCGQSSDVPESCSSCGATDKFTPCGPGVERLYEEVTSLFPQMKAHILSSDYQTSPDKLAHTLEKIRNKEIDILIGTQMVAKGHDFKHLTTVGVVDADLGLGGADLRANEKTFQILEQVSGRAGRHSIDKGNVYIQTFQPQHPVMQSLKDHDRDHFLNIEAQNRLDTQYPPFGHLAALIISAEDQKRVHDFCVMMSSKQPFSEGVTIFGPAPAAIAMLRGRYRYRFLIKTERKISIQNVVDYWLERITVPSYVSLHIDIDPVNFL